MSRAKNLVGQKFNKLQVLENVGQNDSGRYLYRCLCDCGQEKVTNTKMLTSGQCKSCGKCSHTNIKKDLTGQQFGDLTVIEECEAVQNRSGWLCKCRCGEFTKVNTNSLTTGNTTSCGCQLYQNLDLSGQKFGRLQVISKFEKLKEHWQYLCKCDCGNECLVAGYNLRRGEILSCGCLRSEIQTQLGKLRVRENNGNWNGGSAIDHDQRKTKEYKQWRKRVLERDNHTCKICGDTKELEGHHLSDFINSPELRFEISNGICLCNACHTVFHLEFGYGGNSPEQFYKFKASLGV